MFPQHCSLKVKESATRALSMNDDHISPLASRRSPLSPNHQPSTSYPFPLLHILPDLDPRSGGTVSAFEGLAIAQVALGWDVSVATTVSANTDRQVIDRLRSGDVRVIEIQSDGRFRGARQIAAALRQPIAAARLVHVHAVWEEIQHQACSLARAAATPYIVSPHGMLDPWSLSQSKWKKRVYLWLRLQKNLNDAAAIHCTTATERKLLDALNIRAEKFVIPNGIDLREFEVSGERRVASGEVKGEGSGEGRVSELFADLAGRYSHTVLFLARLHPKKGLDLLLPAFAAMRDCSAALVLAGPGEDTYAEHLRLECVRLGIADRVVFTGMLNGPERITALRAADLFVLPSYQENFGIAVIESLAAGTPVIISDQVNLEESIRGSGVGEVIPVAREPLTAAMQRWLQDDDMRQTAAKKAKPFAAQYAFPSIADQWQAKFQEMRTVAASS
jgi:glycosyltransferase involved in cell wall biosynthesis